MLKKSYRYLIYVLVITLFTAALEVDARPLLQTSTPTIRQLADKNNFHFGAAVGTYHFGDPKYVDTLSREFNMLTPENEAKFCSVQPQQGKFDFIGFDKLVDFAEQNKMMVRGHTLVWHQCVPAWLAQGKFSRDEAIQLMHDHIAKVVGRYKGRIAIWDVVNEAIDDNRSGLRDTPWKRLIGDDYVEMAFRFAHEADPDALLIYNDYGAEGMNRKSDAVYALVKDFVARGVPINGVGLQSHFTVGQIDTAKIAENMKRLGELGLQVQITEMDDRYPVNSTDAVLQPQAADYRALLGTCLDSTNCTAFITWGVNDLYTWLRDSNLGFYKNPSVKPLLFDDDYQPKPAYYAVLDILARHAGEAPILSDEQVAALNIETSTAAPIEVKIPAPHKTDVAQLAPDPVAGAAYYMPFPVAITLDGKTDDWANVPRVTVDKGPVLPADNTTSLTFAVAADATSIYFLADVKDSKLIYGKHDAADWYKEDSVEFYINATGNLALTTYKPGVVQITIPAANITQPAVPLIGGNNSADAQVQAVVVKTDGGYRVEASVPLATDVWSITPIQLGTLGFQVHLNGASQDTDRDTKLIWSVYDRQDQSFTNPSVFGKLIFWRVKR